jgi:uncharacterized protein YjbJ (UPF0337 family)
MGIEDKISGRVKQAAGDLLGKEDLRRQGAQEERKADAKREAREAQAQADQKASEAREMELHTDPDKLAEAKTRDELLDEAERLGIEGRSDMTKEELAQEITARK